MSIRFEAKNKRGESLGFFPDDTIVIDEFFYRRDKLSFELKTDHNPAKIRIKVGNQWAERAERTFNLSLPPLEGGRSGGIEVQVYNKGEFIWRDYISIISRDLNKQQYGYLITDLKRYLIDLTSDEATSVHSYHADYLIEIYDKRLKSVQDYWKQLRDNLQDLQRFPNRKVVKDYYLASADKVSKVDSCTIRWQMIHGSRVPGKTMTFTNVESYDIYENQFIVHILDRLEHYLTKLPKTFEDNLDWKISELLQRRERLTEYGRIDEDDEDAAKDREAYEKKERQRLDISIAILEQTKCQKVAFYKEKTKKLQHEVDRSRHLPFLASTQVRSSFVLKPTLVLLRYPIYNAIYEEYLELEEKLKLEERQRIEEILDRAPIERTSKLYEYWIFVQVYEELIRMGFAPKRSSENIENLLKKQGYRLREGNQLLLVDHTDDNIYGRVSGNLLEIRLRYEGELFKPFQYNGNWHYPRRPDIIIEFIRGQKKKILLMDAKYRNYCDQGDRQYSNDVEVIAYHKYKCLEWEEKENGRPKWVKIEIEQLSELRNQIAASFIIHSDSGKKADYGSSGKKNEYGAIALVPDPDRFSSIALRKLLKIFMRMHLKRFDICWSENHPPIEARFKPILDDNPHRKKWEGRYDCQKCGNYWWVNHCYHCGKERDQTVTKIVFKHMSSDNFFEIDEVADDRRLLKCSNCNRSYSQR